MVTKTYADKLKDPRWQKKRLEVFERDGWACQMCGSYFNPLAIHHKYYRKELEPWEYPDDALITLCEECHEEETFFYKNMDCINCYHSIKPYCSCRETEDLLSRCRPCKDWYPKEY